MLELVATIIASTYVAGTAVEAINYEPANKQADVFYSYDPEYYSLDNVQDKTI